MSSRAVSVDERSSQSGSYQSALRANRMQCRCIPSLMTGFVSSKSVYWTEEMLTRSRITGEYLAPEVEMEYTRFQTRDIIPSLIGIGFALVGLLFTVFFRQVNWIGLQWICYSSLLLLLSVIQLCLHFGFRLTARAAAIRYSLCVGMAFLVVIQHFVMIPAALLRTNRELVGGDPRDSTDRVEGAQTLVQVAVLVLFRIKRLPHLVLASIAPPILHTVSSIWLFPTLASDLVLGIQSATLVIAGIISFAIALHRDETLRGGFDDHVRALINSRQLEQERTNVEQLLTALLPNQVIEKLIVETVVSDYAEDASVMFSDIAGFTNWSSNRTASEVVYMVNYLCVKFDSETRRHGVEKVKTIGDAYWAVSGLPTPDLDHHRNIVGFGFRCLDIVAAASRRHISSWGTINIRIGIHSGALSAGVLGKRQLSYEVFGDTNRIAELVEHHGTSGEVTISEDTHRLLAREHVIDDSHYTFSEGEELQLPDGSTLATYKVRRPEPESGAPVHGLIAFDDEVSSQYTASVVDLSNVAHTFLKDRFRSSSFSMASGTSSAPDFDNEGRDAVQSVKEKTAKKRRSCIGTFANDEVEAAYVEFCVTELKAVRTLAGATRLVIPVLCAVSHFVTNDLSDVTVSLALLAAAVVCGSVGILCVRSTRPNVHRGDVVLGGLLCSLTVFAAKAAFNVNSPVTNDPSWIALTLTISYGFTLSFLPWPAILAILILFINVPMLIIMFERRSLFALAVFNAITVNLIAIPVLMTYERFQRQHFREREILRHLENDKRQETKRYELLLSSVMPKSIAKRFRRWIQNEIHSKEDQDLLQFDFANLAVCFIRFQPVAEYPDGAPKDVPQEHKHRNSVNSQDSNGSGPSGGGMPHRSRKQSMVMPDVEWPYMTAVQTALEAVLKRHKAIVKIKTIGNVTLLAGPILRSELDAAEEEEDEETAAHIVPPIDAMSDHSDRPGSPQPLPGTYTVQDAIAQLLLVIENLKQYEHLGHIRSGVHVGPATGVVLGTERMTFDVFGATVNRASRAMSAKEGGVADTLVTREVLRHVHQLPDMRGEPSSPLDSRRTSGSTTASSGGTPVTVGRHPFLAASSESGGTPLYQNAQPPPAPPPDGYVYSPTTTLPQSAFAVEGQDRVHRSQSLGSVSFDSASMLSTSFQATPIFDRVSTSDVVVAEMKGIGEVPLWNVRYLKEDDEERSASSGSHGRHCHTLPAALQTASSVLSGGNGANSNNTDEVQEFSTTSQNTLAPIPEVCSHPDSSDANSSSLSILTPSSHGGGSQSQLKRQFTAPFIRSADGLAVGDTPTHSSSSSGSQHLPYQHGSNQQVLSSFSQSNSFLNSGGDRSGPTGSRSRSGSHSFNSCAWSDGTEAE